MGPSPHHDGRNRFISLRAGRLNIAIRLNRSRVAQTSIGLSLDMTPQSSSDAVKTPSVPRFIGLKDFAC